MCSSRHGHPGDQRGLLEDVLVPFLQSVAGCDGLDTEGDAPHPELPLLGLITNV